MKRILISQSELLARERTHLRRAETGTPPEPSDNSDKYRFGNVLIDCMRHEVLKAGSLQELTNREFRLLEYFVRHPGELLSRERLLREIWGYEVYPSTRTVDNHISRLRKHIEPDPENPRFIKTVRGAGYLFEQG